MSTSTELQVVLADQHRLIAQKLRTVADSAGADRQSGFDDLRRYLAAHEAAAEVGIHSSVTTGPIAPLTGARTAEEHAFARIVTQMESLGIDSAEFGDLLASLSAAVAEHAAAEEQQELPRIVAVTTDAHLDRMLLALRTVPTVTAGSGHSVTMAATFTYADLRLAAATEFGTIPEDTIARLNTPDAPHHFHRHKG
ncbi:MAG: hemerythrin domain-containing protein [Nakamurella sp.]